MLDTIYRSPHDTEKPLLPSDFGLNSFQELIYQPPSKAGDNLDDFDAFRNALLRDLAPIRPHEAVMAENIIMIE